MAIHWEQESTKRGAVVLFLASIGSVGWLLGKDPTGIIILAQAISGYMKLTRSD